MLSKYAPYLGSNKRDEMSLFVTSIYDSIDEELFVTMFHHNMICID